MVGTKVASYAEFRKKVLKKEERLSSKYLIRPLSTRLSWLILKAHPTVTPNQITVVDFCIGLIGVGLLFFARNYFEILIASLILCLWSVFDHVDGEIARSRDMKTPVGFFLEITFDYFIVAMVPLAVSVYLYKRFIQTYLLLIGFLDFASLLSYEFITANYHWTFLRFNTNVSNPELKLTESSLVKKFGGNSLLVNKYTIQIGKITLRIGSFLIYSVHMVLMLIMLTLIHYFFVQGTTLWNQKVTALNIFLLPYLLLVPISVSLIMFYYIILKTRLE